MLHLTAPQAYVALLIAALPICGWVCWTDLKFMKIPNRAVLALGAVFLVVGALTFPPVAFALRWINLPVVLAIGFLLNAIANVGAGDAKFAAAAAPFFAPAHLPLILPLFAAFLLGAFAAHRVLRAIPAVRALTPDWVSWKRKDFPMGLALVGTFVAYLAIMAFPSLHDALFASTTM
ncbi:MAG: prepilin peptidase [Paracoccaceae bacterium]|mgnify:CR=1 FL=1